MNSHQPDKTKNNFVEDGARIMAPYMTQKLLVFFEATGTHFNVEVLSKNDQNHGAAVLKEEPPCHHL